MGNITYC